MAYLWVPVLYIDSAVNLPQVGVGDSPRCLGSARPSVSQASPATVARQKPEQLTGAASPHHARTGYDESAPRGSPDESEPVFVGLDVAKATLDVAVRPSGETWTVANDEAGMAQLVVRVRGLGATLIV